MGRTGTFIAIDIVLERAEKQKRVDMSGVLIKMRHQRMKMVQTAVSNIFIMTITIDILAKIPTQVPIFRMKNFILSQNK